MPRNSKFPPLIGWWIVFCVYCNCLGWVLSAIHQLNARGYVIAFGLAVVAVALFSKRFVPRTEPRFQWRKLRRRFSRLLPASFAVLAFMGILGGVHHRPSNPDGLTQRIPHLLNWLAEEKWHWIEYSPGHFNSHAVGFEWLMAPMLALLKTDRWIFVYNAVSYLLLPGLVFSLFRRLGVTPRAAWHWMWLVPTGYCFLLQAGSIGNDAVGAIFAIAAVDFALRAWESRKCTDVWLSILAAGLLSGTKLSNLPLGLPWLIAIFPVIGLLRQRLFSTPVIALVAVLSSALPLMFLIHQHGGGWTGANLERGLPLASPLVSLTGNCLNLMIENLLPPVFPMAGWWNEHVYKLLPANLIAKLERSFEPGASHLAVMEVQFEICAGIGVGLTLLLLASWIWARFHRQATPDVRTSQLYLVLLRWSPLVSLLVFVLNIDVSGPARLITPYYCLLMPLLLTGKAHEVVVRRKWWRIGALLSVLLSAALLVVNPPRPLWPARTILIPLSARHPQSTVITRAAMLYDAYAGRWDALAPIRNHLPAEAHNVGFIAFVGGSTMETSLWRPFGHRRIWRLPSAANRSDLEKRNITYIIVGTDPTIRTNSENFDNWLQNWLRTNDAKIVAQEDVKIVATAQSAQWFLVAVGSNSGR